MKHLTLNEQTEIRELITNFIIDNKYEIKPSEYNHVFMILEKIYMLKVYNYSAGSFTTAIAENCFDNAINHADYINKKYIKLYKQYVLNFNFPKVK